MNAAADLQKEVRALAEQLALEPFCRKYALDRQSLAKVNLFLGQRETSLERVAPEQPELKESFGRFKALFATFLGQLSQAHPAAAQQLNSVALYDYLQPPAADALEEITQLGRLNLVPPPSQPPMVQELSDESDDSEISFSMPGDTVEEASDKTVMGIINFVDEPDESNATLTELEIEAPMVPVEPPTTSVLLSPLEEKESGPSPWDTEPMTPQEPVAAPVLTVIHNEDTVDWSVPGEPKEEQDETIRVRIPKAVATAPVPTNTTAQEFYALAGYFQTQRPGAAPGAPGIPSGHLARLESQQIIFAIEMEFQERLAELTPNFWPRRTAHIAPLWDKSSTKGEFHPELLKCWDALSRSGASEWPAGERLPTVTFRNALKILTMTNDPAAARLSTLEAGLWIFLFGQERSIGPVTLHNGLGLPEMGQEQTADAFLRLCRVHRLKATLVNPSAQVTEAECAELRAHAEALFQFSQSWLTRSGSGS